MSESSRDLLVAAALVAVASLGFIFDATAEPASVARPAAESGGFVARATFCPPRVPAEGARTEITVASANTHAVALRSEPGERSGELDPGGLFLRPAALSGSAITGFGGRVQAGANSVLARGKGAAAAACSEAASDRWYFAEGSSELGADQRLLLYNPFLDEAILRVVFHTAAGPVSKAALADVAVPSGQAVEVVANDFVLREPLLATSVLVTRGRVVAWRVQLPDDDRAGMQMSLGAPHAAPEWYFPYGALGPDSDQRISVLNPGLDEAVVSVTLATAKSVQQPPRLVELSVPPESARRIAVGKLTREPSRDLTVSAWVTSANGVPVVAERRVTSHVEGAEGVTSEVGSTEAASRWVLPPAAGRARGDSVEVMNPGSQDAIVALSLLRAGEPPLRPPALRRIEVPAGLRTSIDVGRWSREAVLAVLLEADRPVVAERWAAGAGRSSDATASLGVPVRPSGPR